MHYKYVVHSINIGTGQILQKTLNKDVIFNRKFGGSHLVSLCTDFGISGVKRKSPVRLLTQPCLVPSAIQIGRYLGYQLYAH